MCIFCIFHHSASCALFWVPYSNNGTVVSGERVTNVLEIDSIGGVSFPMTLSLHSMLVYVSFRTGRGFECLNCETIFLVSAMRNSDVSVYSIFILFYFHRRM